MALFQLRGIYPSPVLHNVFINEPNERAEGTVIKSQMTQNL